MADYSWIESSTKNIANLFGLNPAAAAKGRALQAQQEYAAARTENTKADMALSPYRQKVYEAQAGKYGADTGKTQEETKGLGISNNARTGLSALIASGGAGFAEDGSLVITPQAVNAAGGFLAAMDANPKVTMDSLRGLGAMAGKNARARAQAGGISAAFRPDAAFSDPQGQEIMGAKEDAALERTTTGANIRGQYSVKAAEASKIAGALAKGGQPDQGNLNAQAAGNKLGAEFALSIPFNGSYLDEAQANQLSQAARAANPYLNPQDAVMKFVNDNPGMLQKQEGSYWWSKDKVKIPGGIPVTLPAARPQGISGSFAQPATPGNIDINNRPVLKNPNGSISTESSISIGVDGKEVLIPTIVEGQRVSNQQAIEHFKQTGQHLGIFNTVDEANAYAQSLHNRQNAAYATPQYQPGQGMPPYRQVQGPSAQAPATAEPVRITNDDSGKAAYARLPSGTPFVDPNGQRRIKP